MKDYIDSSRNHVLVLEETSSSILSKNVLPNERKSCRCDKIEFYNFSIYNDLDTVTNAQSSARSCESMIRSFGDAQTKLMSMKQ